MRPALLAATVIAIAFAIGFAGITMAQPERGIRQPMARQRPGQLKNPFQPPQEIPGRYVEPGPVLAPDSLPARAVKNPFQRTLPLGVRLLPRLALKDPFPGHRGAVQALPAARLKNPFVGQ